MNDYSKITALYSRLSVGDEDRDGGESNSIQNQKKFLESYARQLKLTNIRHYIDDDESGRFGTSGKPIATEAPYGYVKAPDNKDFWLIDEEAAETPSAIPRTSWTRIYSCRPFRRC